MIVALLDRAGPPLASALPVPMAGTPTTLTSPGVVGDTPRTARPGGGRRIITCRNCKQDKEHRGHQLCGTCWQRWNSAGRPDEIPPPMPKAEQLAYARSRRTGRRTTAHQNRLADYYEMTRLHRVQQEEAAQRLGVGFRTVKRYETELHRDGVL
ncbi:MAG: hypothetical protein ACRDP6_37210 [Actinoallomurus sp.]